MHRFQIFLIAISFVLLQARPADENSTSNIVKRSLDVQEKVRYIESQSSHDIYRQLIIAKNLGRSCRVEIYNDVPTFVIKANDLSKTSSEEERIPLEGCTENVKWQKLCHYINLKDRTKATFVHAIENGLCSDLIGPIIIKDDIPADIRARKYAIWTGLDISQRNFDYRWTQLCSVILKDNDQSQSCSKSIQGDISALKVLTNCDIHRSTEISRIKEISKMNDEYLQMYDYAIKFADDDGDQDAAIILKNYKNQYQTVASSQSQVSAQMNVRWYSDMKYPRPRECEVVLIGNVKMIL